MKNAIYIFTLIVSFSSSTCFSAGYLSSDAKKKTGAEYLIITPDVFIPSLQPLKQFRIRQGISTVVVGTSVTGSNFTNIKAYINDAYNTWQIPPVSVLLVGDHHLLPSGIWNNYALSDNLYADMNGDDLPDLFIARIPVTTGFELDQTINRNISAETDPVSDPYYYEHPLACTDFSQTQSTGWMVAEIFNGFYSQVLNKNPERQYVGTVTPSTWPDAALLQLFGPEGLGYIPESPEYLSGFSGGSAAGINNALNAGAMTFFCINNQGNETGFSSPAYQNADLAGLNGPPDFFISVNSLNGKFNYSNTNCLAESYLKNNHAGIGVIAASDVIYSTGSEWFTFGVIDGLWDEFYPAYENPDGNEFKRPCQALMNAKYFLYSLPFSINPQIKQTFYHLFHYFGEPYSVLFTEVPQDLQVLHPEFIVPDQTEIMITADSGAFIAVVKGEEIQGTYHATGYPVVYQIPSMVTGDSLHITVTRQNFRRYHAAIPCLLNNSIGELTGNETMCVFPNPAGEKLHICWSQSLSGNVSFDICNLYGEKVFGYQSLTEQPGIRQMALDVSGWENGVYFLTSHDGKCLITRKLLISK